MDLLAQARAGLEPERVINVETILEYDMELGDRMTPCQRAAARIVDNRPLLELCDHEHVRAMLNMDDLLPNDRRLVSTLFILVSGIRTGKSQMASARCISSTQTVDLDGLSPGEVPRIPLVSVTEDLGQVCLGHVQGAMESSARLRKLLLPTPRGQKRSSSSLYVRHPSGRPVEIKVSPGAKFGGSLVARWMAGGVFDEAPRMGSSSEGLLVNLEDQVHSIRGRIRPGGVIMLIGSAFHPQGLVYEQVQEFHGKPQPHCVVMVADARWMNPAWWNDQRCAELQAADPDVYATEVQSKFIDRSGNMFGDTVEMCTRSEADGANLPPRNGGYYVATMDPATRRNTWTFAIWTMDELGKIIQVYAKEWVPKSATLPLSPRQVISEIAGVCKMYGVQVLVTDQKAFDELRDIAMEFDLVLRESGWTASNKREMYSQTAARMRENRVELCPLPEIRQDLLNVVKVSMGTSYRIELRKDGTGRHADWAPTVVLGVCEFLVYHDTPSDSGPKDPWDEIAAAVSSQADEYGDELYDYYQQA